MRSQINNTGKIYVSNKNKRKGCSYLILKRVVYFYIQRINHNFSVLCHAIYQHTGCGSHGCSGLDKQ